MFDSEVCRDDDKHYQRETFCPLEKWQRENGQKTPILAKQIVSVSLRGCGRITSAGTVSIRNPDKPEVNAIELLA